MIYLVLLLLVGLTLFIGHLVTAGPEREMADAVQRHVDELNSRYERLFRSEQRHSQQPAEKQTTKYL